MNATLSTRRLDHPPQQQYLVAVRRVGTLDRLALHLGVALIKWGRRPHLAATREQLTLQHEEHGALVQREIEAQRELLLTSPLR